jgi:hypothetical protein
MNLYSLNTLDKHRIISACFLDIRINISITNVLRDCDLSGLGEMVKPFVTVFEPDFAKVDFKYTSVDWCDIQVDDDGEEYEDGFEIRFTLSNRLKIIVYFFITGEMHHYEFA